MEGSYEFPDNLWKDVSGEAKDLIRKLLTVDPRERITVSEALEHPWMKVMMVKLLTVSPKRVSPIPAF